MSRGLLIIIDDQDFIYRREEDNLERPKNFLEGLGFGLRSTITGVAGGLTGIVEKPFVGYQQQGIMGIFKGTARGFGGLIIMPISGAIDFFSKTSEGIKNSVNSGDKIVNKIRTYRPFYGFNQQIKVYDSFHAIINQHLFRINRGIYVTNHFLDAFYYNTDTSQNVVILTEEHFIVRQSLCL